MANKQTQLVDLVIVGGGMVGCLLALAVIKQSPQLNVVLVDNNSQETPKGKHPGFDARSIALSAGSCALLDELGLWDSLVQNAQAIQDIHISDRGCLGIVELESATPNWPFGYVVELQQVGRVLEQQLKLYPQISCLYQSSLTNIEKYNDHLHCELQDGGRINTRLCVAADGGNSETCSLLGLEQSQSDYGCSAIIANVSCSKPHKNRAFERFTASGPLALLPLTDNRYSLVWSVENDQLPRLMAMDEKAFLAALQQAFGFRSGLFEKAGLRDCYPLTLQTVAKPLTHRGVAIGNAAHTLHPVMGQGFNLGMRDLSTLAKVIAECDATMPIGSFSMLNRYWQARKTDHHATIAMTDTIVRVFSNQSLAVKVGRTIGLQMIAALPALGTPIVKQAKGQFNLFKKEEKS